MQLNPYALKRYLRPRPQDPAMGGWMVFAVFVALLLAYSHFYMAPDAVAVDLPQAVELTMENPPSVFAVITQEGVIYRNRLLTTRGFLEAIESVQDKGTVLLVTPAHTPIEDVVPIMQKAQALGFNDVAFTVRP